MGEKGAHRHLPRLRFRVAKKDMPGPVRTKQEPYAKKDSTEAEQRECDRGTIMVSWAITMAKTVANRDRPGKIKSIATFVEHLFAWAVQFNIFP